MEYKFNKDELHLMIFKQFKNDLNDPELRLVKEEK